MALITKKPIEKSTFIPFEEQNVLRKSKLLLVVVRQGQSDAIKRIFADYNVAMTITTLGTGLSFTKEKSSSVEGKKEFIFAIVCEDKIDPLMRRLGERFSVSRVAQGIAYTVDITSIAGVSIYKFLTNTRKVTKVTKNDKRK